MPRLNIEDQLFLDIMTIATKVGDVDKALGNAVRFFRYSQEKHKQGQFLTEEEFQEQGFMEALIPIIAKRTPSGIQAVGAKKHFAWLDQKFEAGLAGGKQSAKRPRDKKGRLLPSDQKEVQANSKRSTSKTQALQPSLSLSSSLSLSNSLNISGEPEISRREPEKTPGSIAFDAYAEAYEAKYHNPPVRNKKVNTQFKYLAERIGEDAPAVARFYLTHNQFLYTQSMHCTDLLLRDAEKLRTEWITGNKVTSIKAKQIESNESNRDAMEEYLQKKRQTEREVGEV